MRSAMVTEVLVDKSKQMITDKELHCCRRWDEDYCACAQERMKLAKRKARNKAVRTTLNLLERNKIPYERTKTENVVQLYPKRNSGILLSLKCTHTEYGYKFTCRWIDGHWHYYTKQQLLDKLLPTPKPQKRGYY